jgi:hypothetical protein
LLSLHVPTTQIAKSWAAWQALGVRTRASRRTNSYSLALTPALVVSMEERDGPPLIAARAVDPLLMGALLHLEGGRRYGRTARWRGEYLEFSASPGPPATPGYPLAGAPGACIVVAGPAADDAALALPGLGFFRPDPANALYRRGPMGFELVDERPWQLGVMLPDPDGRIAGRALPGVIGGLGLGVWEQVER